MRTLNVAELIGRPSAILQKFGLQLHGIVRELLDSGEPIELDFSSIRNATSAFFHASVGNLRRDLGDRYNDLIFVSGLDNPLWKEKYDEAIEFATNPEQAHQHDSAISELLAV